MDELTVDGYRVTEAKLLGVSYGYLRIEKPITTIRKGWFGDKVEITYELITVAHCPRGFEYTTPKQVIAIVRKALKEHQADQERKAEVAKAWQHK